MYYINYNNYIIYDISIALQVIYGKQINFNSILTNQTIYKLFNTRFDNNFIQLIPEVKLKQLCKKYINSILYILQQNLDNIQQFIFVNNNATSVFFNIQKNGIQVNTDKVQIYYNKFYNLIKNNKLYSDYNLNTVTGRPSNSNGINFAALNRTNGQRQMIISRFTNGLLLQVDFSAYHLALISGIVGYKFPKGCNIHQQMAKQYFNTDFPTQEQIIKSKQISFTALYGGVQNKYKNIQFLKLVQNYVNEL